MACDWCPALTGKPKYASLHLPPASPPPRHSFDPPASSPPRAPAVTADALQAKLAALEARSATLNPGMQRSLARATATLARLFMEWSARDAADENGALATVGEQLAASKYMALSSPGGWREWASTLAARQLTDAATIVDSAFARAQPPPIHRSATPTARLNFDGADSGATLVGATMGSDGYWRGVGHGRVVFAHGFSKVLNFLLSSKQYLPVSKLQHDLDGAVGDMARSLALPRRQLASLGINQVTCHINPKAHLGEDMNILTDSSNVLKCKARLPPSPTSPASPTFS